MASILIVGAILPIVGSFVESKYTINSSSSSARPGQISGWSPMILMITCFWAGMHGETVGHARTKYMELAKKDGEENVEERYALPNLYAQGISKYARAFNCVQRSHQHIFESFTQLCVASLVASVNYPVTAAISTLTYAIGRYSLSVGYAAAEGDPTKRYSSPLAVLTWYGLMSTTVLGMISAFKIAIKK